MDKKGFGLTLLVAVVIGVTVEFLARLLNIPTHPAVVGGLTGFGCVTFYNHYFEEK